jgi:hypothetical protein
LRFRGADALSRPEQTGSPAIGHVSSHEIDYRSRSYSSGDDAMSGLVAASAVAAITTAATVVVASLPDAQALLSPLTDSGNEYAIATASVLASLPMLGIMAVLAISGRE